MKVIFIRELPGTAKKGEVKEVNDGYAKNFLIAKGFAVLATAPLLNKALNEEKQRFAKLQKEQQRAKALVADLAKRTFAVSARVSDKNQIFGSVSEKDLAARIKEKMNLNLGKDQIILPKHIKEPGEYEFQIKLGSGLIATSKIKVEAK